MCLKWTSCLGDGILIKIEKSRFSLCELQPQNLRGAVFEVAMIASCTGIRLTKLHMSLNGNSSRLGASPWVKNGQSCLLNNSCFHLKHNEKEKVSRPWPSKFSNFIGPFPQFEGRRGQKPDLVYVSGKTDDENDYCSKTKDHPFNPQLHTPLHSSPKESASNVLYGRKKSLRYLLVRSEIGFLGVPLELCSVWKPSAGSNGDAPINSKIFAKTSLGCALNRS